MTDTPNTLASYAVTANRSKGRLHDTKPHPYRSCFDRDRDRIIHCEAFRRLEGKTQVFTPGVNDSYRNRLTHSIEVAQIGRTIASALNVNQSLVETICLGHDLGHSPFGHAGEMVLNDVMKDFGGFEHNKQTLRITEILEHPYPKFFGLNLMYETRLGLARHRSPYDKPEEDQFPELQCSLEGQISNIADRIAYNCHDLEDGIRSGLISESQLKQMDLFSMAQELIHADSIEWLSVRSTRSAKAIIEILVSDAVSATQDAINKANIKTLDDIYNYDCELVRLSDNADKKLRQLEKFLLNQMYLSETINNAAEKTKKHLPAIFNKVKNKPELMPRFYRRLADDHGLERAVCDYISGMTDRFCLTLLE